MGDRVHNTNIAGPGSRVVAQINQAGRDVRVRDGGAARSVTPEDLPALLDTLREDVRASTQRGEIDAMSTEAFEAELEEARSHLPVTDEESRSRFVVAMRRAKGLVEGMADLTTKVSEAIEAVQGIGIL